jgi:hypothetical protein
VTLWNYVYFLEGQVHVPVTYHVTPARRGSTGDQHDGQ